MKDLSVLMSLYFNFNNEMFKFIKETLNCLYLFWMLSASHANIRMYSFTNNFLLSKKAIL